MRLKSIVKIPSAMWNSFYEADKLDTLSYFCQLRALYRNPVIYNFSYKELSLLMGLSANSLRTHFKYLRTVGVISLQGGHLVVKGHSALEKLYPSKGKLLTIKTQKRLCDTKIIVKSIPVLSHLRSQNKYIKRAVKKEALASRSENSYLSSKDRRFLSKSQRKTAFGYMTMSNQKIGQHLQRSKSTGAKYKKQLKSLGVLDYRRKFRIISNSEYHNFIDWDGTPINGARYINDLLVREVSNQFKIDDSYTTYSNDCFVKTYSWGYLANK